ncbi:PAAR domain-containing protein [Pseudomonas syringae]
MKLLAIVQGDTTDHGGSVINGDQTKRINGFPVAHRAVTSSVHCMAPAKSSAKKTTFISKETSSPWRAI